MTSDKSSNSFRMFLLSLWPNPMLKITRELRGDSYVGWYMAKLYYQARVGRKSFDDV